MVRPIRNDCSIGETRPFQGWPAISERGQTAHACRKLAMRSVFAMLMLTVCAVVHAQSDFLWSTNYGPPTVTNWNGTHTIKINRYTKITSKIIIPTSVNGLPVSTIDAFAFDACPGAVEISIPPSVSKLGNAAILPFIGCFNLERIEVEPANASFSSTNGCLLNKSQTMFICCPSGKAGCVTIPSSVRSIGADSFLGCTKITNLTIPNSVTNIGYGAFSGCTSLTNITIPDSVAKMAGGAFGGCANLARVTFGRNIKDIGLWTFSHCPNLRGVYFEGDAPGACYTFDAAAKAIIYYKPGTKGWGETFEGRPTAIWKQ